MSWGRAHQPKERGLSDYFGINLAPEIQFCSKKQRQIVGLILFALIAIFFLSHFFSQLPFPLQSHHCFKGNGGINTMTIV